VHLVVAAMHLTMHRSLHADARDGLQLMDFDRSSLVFLIFMRV